MYFSCTGLLTKWIIGSEVKSSGNSYPELQLWRTSDGTTYLKNSSSLVNTDPGSPLYTGVYEYILDPPMEFQEGDVFGLYKPMESQSYLNVFLQENSGPFAYGQESDASTPLTEITVNSIMPLEQNDYPMVSVEISVSSEWY